MDLSYDVFALHSSKRGGHRRKSNATGIAQHSTGNASAPTSFLRNPFSAVTNVAAQTARLPGDVLSTAARIATYPSEVISRLAESLITRTPGSLEDHGVLARRARLLEQLKNAKSWYGYSSAAAELDLVEGAEVWKSVDESELYDETCLRQRHLRLLEVLRQDDLPGMMNLVRTELTRDLGGICNPELHRQTHVGTKRLIEDYIHTVGEVLDRMVKASARGDSKVDKITIESQLKQTRQSYGRTALLLSGGGTLGMTHIGVIKALHEAGALPRIISGSSSGSIVAAVLGNTTDDELLGVLEEFCRGDLNVFVGPHEKPGWMARAEHFGQTGHAFDADNLRRVTIDLLGKTTFLEAYNRTRRVLNITVSNSTEFESQSVLNYATAPTTTIWSAVVASCGVPFGFDPERLMLKDFENLSPWDSSTLHVDGSIEGDVPTNKLSMQFNVNHSVVSQVNPHVSPFLESDTNSGGNRSQYWSTTASLARDEGIRSLEILGEMPFLPQNLIKKLTSVLGQRYSGDITICPADPFRQFWTILKNPTSELMEEALRQGETATWPGVSMIKTHLDIELMIDNAYRKVLEHVSFSQSASDLRRLQIRQSGTHTRSSGGRQRSRQHTQSVYIPVIVQHWSTDERVEVPNHSEKFTEEVTSELSSSSSRSRSSSSASSDVEYESEQSEQPFPLKRNAEANWMPTPDLHSLVIQTQPNTPRLEKRGFVDSPRSGSPRSVSPTLVMTPRVPRSTSPEVKQKTAPQRVDAQSRRAAKSPPPPTRLASGQARSPWGMKSFNLRIPLTRRRSSSTGLRGLPEPGRR